MKWPTHWHKHAVLISDMSPCPRAKVGAFIIDENNNPISAGFNGPPRGASGSLCGGDTCNRDDMSIKSGTRIEVGCHHAEQNAIVNAARKGISLESTWIVINVKPCLACARHIHHAGISRVYVPEDCFYSNDGIRYLSSVGVEIIRL